eukprot:TRINITY_DN37572_c0_g1_i1.p2 TRINITY_DN37572_c0_g1~~TRINITY_DN37572_c0_g1_i1.p2  ORF type:complete len:119 (-),score=38.95 TRINITY_DN37572_c0_g1_i1:24-350(-)
MSKPVSSLITQTVQNSRTMNTFVRQNIPASSYYFTTDNSSQLLDKNPALRFKSAGLQVETSRWGTVWTMQGNNMPNLDKCMKQKMVKVTTNSGETLMAISYNTDSCSF